MRCGDTSFFVDLFDPERTRHEAAADWHDAHGNRPLFAPAIVNWDLYRGAVRISESYTTKVGRFMAAVETLHLTEDSALEAARIDQEPRDAGEPLAKADCVIAGIVRSVGGILVTRDRDFERVRDLTCEFY